MRILAIIALLAATPALARTGGPWPADGLYCGNPDTMPILVKGRIVGIDGLDCQAGRISGGRFVDKGRCYGNGGSVVSYDTDLEILPDGSLRHDGALYRRREARPPCP